jgi:hypothetical protein
MAGIQFTNSPQRFLFLIFFFSHRWLCGYNNCTRKHFQLLFFLLRGGEYWKFIISIGVFITGSFISSTTQQQWQ